MTALKPGAGAVLLLIGAAVAVHLIATQLYDPTVEGTARTVWAVLDPLMVVGLLITLLATWGWKRRVDADADRSVSREWLETNVILYLAAALLLAVLWNWIGTMFSEPSVSEGLLWVAIDSTLPLLLASVGLRLLRE